MIRSKLPKMTKQFNFIPDVDIKEGMELLKELVFDNLTCNKEQRYLILCWMISSFMFDSISDIALMKFSGISGAGKTTAARLLSSLLLGTDQLNTETIAAASYIINKQIPLLVFDNLEVTNLTKNILKFLLLNVTKYGKGDRAEDTDAGSIHEQSKTLMLITTIGPFTKAELICRTYDIEFSPKHKKDGFIEDEAIRALIKKRDIILSSILKLAQKEILSNLPRRKDFIAILEKEHKNHSKHRTDGYLATLLLILEELLKYMPYYAKGHSLYGLIVEEQIIRHAWIEYQDSQNLSLSSSSNNINSGQEAGGEYARR